MKYFFMIVLNLALIFEVSAASKQDMQDSKVRLGYSIGYQIGGDFLRHGKDIDPLVLLKGVQDALADKKPLMTRKEMRTTLVNFQKTVAEARKENMLKQAKKNLESGMAFLAENGKKEDVKTLPSGLQYRVIKEGAGKVPALSDTVSVHYRGTLIDGTEFDSSHRMNKPAAFTVNGVISGWTEALQLMREGANWQLFIPPDLGYGDKRTGIIEPNSTLIFDVELIEITNN